MYEEREELGDHASDGKEEDMSLHGRLFSTHVALHVAVGTARGAAGVWRAQVYAGGEK